MTPELSRPFARDRVGEGAHFVVEANEAERAALARRMSLPSILRLTCSFDLQRAQAGAIPATGHLQARVVQICIVSLEPFDVDISETFEVRFVPEGSEGDELDLDAVDEIPYAGNILELGEAAAEQLALALDPFPRKPGAELPASDGGEENGPFAALGKLRQQG